MLEYLPVVVVVVVVVAVVDRDAPVVGGSNYPVVEGTDY